MQERGGTIAEEDEKGYKQVHSVYSVIEGKIIYVGKKHANV